VLEVGVETNSVVVEKKYKTSRPIKRRTLKTRESLVVETTHTHTLMQDLP
jgi:hypothetical protein